MLYPDPALGKQAAPATVDGALRAIGARLCEAAMAVGAYGLAAAHLGEVAPVIVLNVTPAGPKPSYEVFYNPRVVAVAGDLAGGPEASVSLPGVEISIERPNWAEIAYQDGDGVEHQQRFDGFVARCALHEIEQMNGRFFLANVSRLKRDMAIRKSLKQRAG